MLRRLLLTSLIFSAVAFAQNALAPFEGTHWTLTELNGEAVAQSSDPRPAYLQFTAEGNKVSGSTGCNRLAGSYERGKRSLKFHPLATTRMACIGPSMEQENKFNNALAKVTRYKVEGDTLMLFSKEQILARFKARPADKTGSEN